MIPIFRGAQHIYCTKLTLTVAYNNNPIRNNIPDKIHNKTYYNKYCFESKCQQDKMSKAHNIRYKGYVTREDSLLQIFRMF